MSNKDLTQVLAHRSVWQLGGMLCALLLIVLFGGAFPLAQSPRSIIQAKVSGNLAVSPEPDWIYVVDPMHGAEKGQILLLDPATGLIQRTVETGHHPDAAISNDGTRLYISTGGHLDVRDGWFSVFRTADGYKMATVPNPGAMRYTLPLYVSSLAVSNDDTRVYVVRNHQTLDGKIDRIFLATFDVATTSFLREECPLPNCHNASMMPMGDGRVAVLCPRLDELRILSVDANGSVESEERITLRHEGRRFASKAAFVSASGQEITVLSGTGRGLRFHGQAREPAEPLEFSRSESVLDPAEPATTAAFLQARFSRAASDLYVGSSTQPGKGLGSGVERIEVVDPGTLTVRSSIELAESAMSIVASRDGGTVFAISPEQASVSVVDIAAGLEIATIRGVGIAPIFALTQP
jgi:DNA-binding beta-propeller fold protein YncE